MWCCCCCFFSFLNLAFCFCNTSRLLLGVRKMAAEVGNEAGGRGERGQGGGGISQQSALTGGANLPRGFLQCPARPETDGSRNVLERETRGAASPRGAREGAGLLPPPQTQPRLRLFLSLSPPASPLKRHFCSVTLFH